MCVHAHTTSHVSCVENARKCICNVNLFASPGLGLLLPGREGGFLLA